MANSKEIRFDLDITAEQYLHYYSGLAREVQVRSIDGRRVQFPANILQPFVTHHGIQGEFILSYDDDNRVADIRRVGD